MMMNASRINPRIERHMPITLVVDEASGKLIAVNATGNAFAHVPVSHPTELPAISQGLASFEKISTVRPAEIRPADSPRWRAPTPPRYKFSSLHAQLWLIDPFRSKTATSKPLDVTPAPALQSPIHARSTTTILKAMTYSKQSWYWITSGGPLSGTPTVPLSEVHNPAAGDIYVRILEGTTQRQLWLYGPDNTWKALASDAGSTLPPKVQHPTISRLWLDVSSNGKPEWLKSETFVQRARKLAR